MTALKRVTTVATVATVAMVAMVAMVATAGMTVLMASPPAAAGRFAAPVALRLATIAPVNSSWHKALLDMGAAWSKSTDGRVTVTVYAGGTQGGEPATISMMRAGGTQLQASLLLIAGLTQIDEGFNVFGMPFFFNNDEEARHVQQKLTSKLEERIKAKGFHLLCWGSGGWVQIFSKKPLRTLNDVKQAKLYTAEGDDRMVQWYKDNGFHPVALSSKDIATQLKLSAGMIDAAPSPAYPALVLQMFRDAKYMLELKVAPLVGALVISTDAWNKIPAEDRAKMTEAANAFEQRIATEIPKLDADSIAQMKGRGLTVTTLDPKSAAEFHAEADRLSATVRDKMVPPDVYDLALRERDAFRKSLGK